MSLISLRCLSIPRKSLGSLICCVFELYYVCCLFSVLRCRARVAPPIDETEDELSFQDEFLALSRQLGVEVEVEVKLEVDLV